MPPTGPPTGPPSTPSQPSSGPGQTAQPTSTQVTVTQTIGQPIPPIKSGQVTVTVSPSQGQTVPPTAPTAPTGPEIPVFTNADWIGFLQPVTESQPGAAELAVTAANKWRAFGQSAKILRSSDFPNLRIAGNPVREPSYLIYIGAYRTPEEAVVECSGVCIPIQPNPPG